MKTKRGQLSFFLSIAILVVAIIFLSRQETLPSLQDPMEADGLALSQFVQSCLEKTGEDAVYATMLRGGYYQAPIEQLAFYRLRLPLYWTNNQSLLPALDSIEAQISLLIEETIGDCLGNFSEFSAQGIQIVKQGDPKVQTAINPKSTDFSLIMPLLISQEDRALEVDSFRSSTDVKLQPAYRDAQEILDQIEQFPGFIPLGRLAQLAKEHGSTFEILHHSETTVIISLYYPQEGKEDLTFAFAIKLNEEGIDEP